MVNFVGVGLETPHQIGDGSSTNDQQQRNTRHRYPTTPIPFQLNTPNNDYTGTYMINPSSMNTPAPNVVVDDDDDDDEFMPPPVAYEEKSNMGYGGVSSKNALSLIRAASSNTPTAAFGDKSKENYGVGNGEGSREIVPSEVNNQSVLAVIQAEHAAQNVQDPCAQWVIVYGFRPEEAQGLLYQFAGYGSILRQTGGVRSGNFICLKYNTRMQAEKALCQSGTFCPGSRDLIGVRRMDAQIASEIGLNLNDDQNDDIAGLKPIGAGMYMGDPKDKKDVVENKPAHSPSREVVGDNITADDILLARKVEPSLTYNILAWIFSW